MTTGGQLRPTVVIRLSELHLGSDLEADLSGLEAGDHIHGRLELEIAGRRLPSMGYFGPEDVCVAEWLIELRAVVSASAGDRHASYSYNDPEQGQPGFRFERSGDDLLVSIVDSAMGGSADPNWQRVRCRYSDFVVAVTGLETEVERAVRTAAAAVASTWLGGLDSRPAFGEGI